MAAPLKQKRGGCTNQMSQQIKCYQINIQHSKAATANLMQLISTDKIGIALIQEPYQYQGKLTGITKGYRTFSCGEGKRRAAIIIQDNTIDALLITQQSDNDAVLLEIKNGQISFYAASVYFDYTEPIDNSIKILERILKFTKGKKLLIAIDSNCRSTTWHDIKTNPRGKALEEFLTYNQLHVLNEDSERTTFQSSRGSSNIDLTIANNSMIAAIKDWQILEEESCSDHNIIKYNMNFNPDTWNKHNSQGPRFIIKEEQHIDFHKNFRQQICKNFQIGNESEDTSAMDQKLAEKLTTQADVGLFIDRIDDTIRTTCTETLTCYTSLNKHTKGKSVSWWSSELTIMRKRTNALRRRHQRTQNNEELRLRRKNQYIEEKKKYQAAIRKEKTKSWKQHCTITTPNNPWNDVYRLAAGKTRESLMLTTLIKSDGTRTANMDETLQTMMDQLIPEDNTQDDTIQHKNTRKEANQPMDTANDLEFTMDEIRQTIESFNPKKAPGPDGVTGDILTLIFQSIPQTITSMYNECLKRGHFPEQWKTAKIIPIIKPGKKDSSDPSKYRPISLINIEGKVLEKLLINRIMHHLHKTQFLNHNQFGFIPQKSTTDAAMKVKQFIGPELERRRVVIMTSLDVKGAFDAAWWPAILQGLREADCPRNLYHLTKDYFKDRRAIMLFNSRKIEKSITKGCPQGSCCGPGYWTILYNSLLNIKFTNHTEAIAFADDLVVMTKADSIPEAENIMNAELNKISIWARKNKLQFNEQKSQVMLLTRRKRKENKEIKIYLNNRLLIQVTSMKYLGIIFDCKLNFKEHISYMAEKCTKLIFSLSKSAKLNWGLQHAVIKTIYTGAILPLLLYGAPIWYKALDTTSNKLKLIRVQRLINIKIAKAYRTVSNEALCALTGLMPITIKIQEASQYYNIIRGRGKEYKKVETRMGTQYWMHPAETINFISGKTKDISSVQIYTDGSKTESGVGAGIAIYMSGDLIKSLKYRLNSRCTNNQAEQWAILKALQQVGKIYTEVKTATIFTDSRITLDSLKNTNIHTALVEEIRQQLTEKKKKQWHIQFCWVKAHVGIRGNETADTLAKEAAASTDTPESYDKIPTSVVKSELEVLSIEKWQREWDQSTKGQITKQYFPDIADRLNIKLNLTHNFTLMVTGHGSINSYLHRFKLSDTPTCPCGTQDQTTDHLLFECKLLQKERKILTTTILKSDVWPTSKPDLIKKHFKAFLQFTKAIETDKLKIKHNGEP